MLWRFSQRWLSHLHGQMSNPGDVTCVQLPPGRYFLQWFLAPVASAAPPAGGPRKMTRVIAGRIVRKGKQRFLPVTACARSVDPAVRSVVGAGFAAGPPLSVRAADAVNASSYSRVCVPMPPGPWIPRRSSLRVAYVHSAVPGCGCWCGVACT